MMLQRDEQLIVTLSRSCLTTANDNCRLTINQDLLMMTTTASDLHSPSRSLSKEAKSSRANLLGAPSAVFSKMKAPELVTSDYLQPPLSGTDAKGILRPRDAEAVH